MTRIAAIAALAVLLPLVARAAEPPTTSPDFTGAWKVSGRIELGGTPVAAVTPVCQFRQAGAALTGTCKGPNSEGPAEGTAKGGHVSWRWNAVALNPVGMNSVASFEGDVGPDGVIHGRWSVSALPGASGDFSQERN